MTAIAGLTLPLEYNTIYAHLLPDAHWRGAEYAAKALGEMPEIVVE